MYEIDLLSSSLGKRNIVAVYATRSHIKPTDIDTWHRRLGHVAYPTIEQMNTSKAVDGQATIPNQ